MAKTQTQGSSSRIDINLVLRGQEFMQNVRLLDSKARRTM